MTYTVTEAQKKLPELVKKAEAGSRVTITKRGVAVVEIVRKSAIRRRKRILGGLDDEITFLSPDWDKPQNDLDSELLLSSISITEIVLKKQSRRRRYFDIELSTVRKLIDRLDITLIDYTAQHAEQLELVTLLPDHQEPFDRMIIATALVLDVPLIGGDREFENYKKLKVIW